MTKPPKACASQRTVNVAVPRYDHSDRVHQDQTIARRLIDAAMHAQDLPPVAACVLICSCQRQVRHTSKFRLTFDQSEQRFTSYRVARQPTCRGSPSRKLGSH